uniref:mitochondrial outer membrane protein porin of 36 kDa-like n=1 Tax=Erigeron canadensis TaxID=72917 RepID=UPI001CB8F65E|nr:mitochondrial outer membrane protein porin of 36 kDa-like [Erigeron canadensis]
MMNGPRHYHNLSKEATDLLYKYYSNFSRISHTGANRRYEIALPLSLFLSFKSKELAPGLKTIFSCVVPDKRSGMVELQYSHKYAAISTSIGLTAKPIVNFSGVTGNNTVAVGTDVSFDTASGTSNNYNVALSFSNFDFNASLTLNDKADTLTATCYHTVNLLTNTAVGAEFKHRFSSNNNSLTIGTQHSLDPLTMVKARVNNAGKVSALLQYQWRPKSVYIISVEVDTRAITKIPKFGLSFQRVQP